MSSRNDELTLDSMLDEVFMMYQKEMFIMQSKSEDVLKEKFRNLLAIAIEKDYLGVVKVVGDLRVFEAKEKGLSLSLDNILSSDIFCNRLARTVKLFTDFGTTKQNLSSCALNTKDNNSIISTSSSGNSHGSISDSTREDDASQESLECKETAVNSHKDGSSRKMRSNKNGLNMIVKREEKSGRCRSLDIIAPRRAISSNSSSTMKVMMKRSKSRHSDGEKRDQQCIEDHILFGDDSTSSRARMEAQRENRGS